jgi:dolichol-phosphate mannosyltransferase
MNNLLSIVIPVYHEEKSINTLLTKLSTSVKTKNEILIVYDTKDDPTIEAVKKYLTTHKKVNLQLIKNCFGNNRGVLNAIRTGFSKIKGDAAVVIMADLSDDLKIIDKMYQKIKKGDNIVCGSRYMKGGKKIGGPILKSLMSKVAGISLYYLGIPTHDSTNAFKMYSKDVLGKIKIESKAGFEYSLELIAKAYSLGFKISEIPSTWIDRTSGKSKFKILEWLPSYIKWYFLAAGAAIKNKF